MCTSKFCEKTKDKMIITYANLQQEPLHRAPVLSKLTSMQNYKQRIIQYSSLGVFFYTQKGITIYKYITTLLYSKVKIMLKEIPN